MEELVEHSLEVMILLMSGIFFDILTIIYNIFDFLFGIGLVIAAIFNFIPALYFTIFSLAKIGTEELEEKIEEKQPKNSEGGSPQGKVDEVKEKVGKAKKAVRLIKEMWSSAKAYAKSATPFYGLTFPWTRKVLKDVWDSYTKP